MMIAIDGFENVRTTIMHGVDDAPNAPQHLQCRIHGSDNVAPPAVGTTFRVTPDTDIANAAVAAGDGGRFSDMIRTSGYYIDDYLSYPGSVTASPSEDGEMSERTCLRCDDIDYVIDDARDIEILPPRKALSLVGRPANTTGRIRVGWKYQAVIPPCATY